MGVLVAEYSIMQHRDKCIIDEKDRDLFQVMLIVPSENYEILSIYIAVVF